MFSLFFKSEEQLTTLGMVTGIVLAALIFCLMLYFAGKETQKKRVSTKQLVYSGVALALAFVTSYVKLVELPWGGSITLCSMLFIVLIANWYGTKAGVAVGFAFGIMQFLQGPYVLNFVQVCFDYFLPFAALGLAGIFAGRKYGLQIGYIVGVLARGVFHAIAGYAFWMSYMPDNFPKSLSIIYPIAYNYSYLLAEGVITLLIISIPAVSKGLAQIRRQALS